MTGTHEDAFLKEMKNASIAFNMKEDGEKPPPGYNFVNLMLMFEISFRRKCCLVTRGNQTAPPSLITYSSVVSRGSMRIALLMAVINYLDIKTFDNGNAYLMELVEEKLFTKLEPEFDENEGNWQQSFEKYMD